MPESIQFVEAQGTRWAASALHYLHNLGEAELRAELKRLFGAPEATAAEPEHEGA